MFFVIFGIRGPQRAPGPTKNDSGRRACPGGLPWGELWSDFAESNFTSSFQGRRIETNRRARATLRVVNGLVSGQDIPPSDFWTWRKVHRKRAILYPIFLVRSPRLALLYISIFDGALLQDALTVDPKAALMDAVLPARAAAPDFQERPVALSSKCLLSHLSFFFPPSFFARQPLSSTYSDHCFTDFQFPLIYFPH